MSKIGKKPIEILEGVETKEIDENKFEIKGPKGSLIFELHPDFKLEKENNFLKIVPLKELDKKTKAIYGTLRAILNNKIIGVKEGFEKVLILEGVGYQVEVQGEKLYFRLGFSHPVSLDIPDDIKIEIESGRGRNIIKVKGIDKEKVGLFAAEIKKIKPADRYHLKGFRYIDEVIKTKPTKKVVK